MRMIDANELLGIERLLDTDVVRQSKTASWLLDQVLHDIQAMPTLTPQNEPLTIEHLPAADVAPVVRCCECVHKGKEGENIVFCENFERDMMPDDFCSAGERR